MASHAYSTDTLRRGFLHGLAFLPLIGGCVAGSAAPAGAASATLSDLIEAHESAFDRLEHAVGVRNGIEKAINEDRRKNLVLVPMAVMPNGKFHVGCYELGVISPDDIRKGIRDTHDKLRQRRCSEGSRVVTPEFVAAVEQELDASQARALQALADAEAANEAREQEREAGLRAAQEAVDATEDDEFEARLSLAVYSPHNAAEAGAKRAYVEQSPPFREGWGDDFEFVIAMMARIDTSLIGSGHQGKPPLSRVSAVGVD